MQLRAQLRTLLDAQIVRPFILALIAAALFFAHFVCRSGENPTGPVCCELAAMSGFHPTYSYAGIISASA